MMSLGPLEICCLATRRLDDPMPTIVQHLMRALAGRVRVLYVEPAVDPVFLARAAGRRVLRPSQAPGGLTRCVPVVLPWGWRSAAVARANRRLVIAQVRRQLHHWRSGETVLWVQAPLFAWLADALPELPLCDYASDDYRQSPAALSMATAETVAGWEARLLARARWVLVNSPALLAADRFPPERTHWVPSGVDVRHYRGQPASGAAPPEALRRIPRPVAGFLGVVDDYKVDCALLEHCARALPGVSFVTVGPIGWREAHDRIPAPAGPNIHHLGMQPYADLPAYLRAFDVGLLPNRTTGYMASNFPMKLFEYFAAGVPVVATDLPALRPFAPWIRIACTAEDFCREVWAALATAEPDRRREALEIAEHNTWERQAARVLDILAGRSAEPVLPLSATWGSQGAP